MHKKYAFILLIFIVAKMAYAQKGEYPEPDAFVHVDKPAEALNLEEFYLNLTYPAEIYETKKEGNVYLKVLVDKKGRYVKHLVLKSADSLFTLHAARTIPILKFSPAQSGGKATATWVTVPVKFQIKTLVPSTSAKWNKDTKRIEGFCVYYSDHRGYGTKDPKRAVKFFFVNLGKGDSIVPAKIYTRNGLLIGKGTCLYRGDSLSDHGKFEYYINDSIKVEEGVYHENKKEGEWTEYFDNGQRKTIINYLSGKKNGAAYTWYENGKTKTEGYFKDGKKNGIFIRYDSAGKPFLRLLYENDKLVKAYEYGTKGDTTESKKNLDTYNRPPEFKGNFKEYIKNNLQYPLRAHKKGISGEVYVRFFIDEKGVISDSRIVRGIGYGCDEEALRLIELTSGNWNPAVSDGAVEKTVFIQKITFR